MRRNPDEYKPCEAWIRQTWESLKRQRLSPYALLFRDHVGEHGYVLDVRERTGLRCSSHEGRIIQWSVSDGATIVAQGEFVGLEYLHTLGEDGRFSGYEDFFGFQETCCIVLEAYRGKRIYASVLEALPSILNAPLAGDAKQSQAAQRVWARVGKLDALSDLYLIPAPAMA